MKKWQCLVCGLIYDEAEGWPEDGIDPGTRWGDVPEGWLCPDCGVGKEDFEMVQWAMEVTGVLPFRHRKLDTLSGGQKQRVWIALCLAQDTDIIFLDEPTTYLDIAHQLEILEILEELKTSHGKTIVMVLHDLNQASSYSDYLIALKDGQIVKEGTSKEVITEEVLMTLFNIKANIVEDENTNKPLCLSFKLL